jgi:hypothetical protein
MGWVSILDPRTITAILDVPANWKLIGYFCECRRERHRDIVSAYGGQLWVERPLGAARGPGQCRGDRRFDDGRKMVVGGVSKP